MEIMKRVGAASLFVLTFLTAFMIFAFERHTANRIPSVSRSDVRTESLSQTTPKLLTSQQVKESYGKLPLIFEANEGQVDARVKFISRGPVFNLYLTPQEALLIIRKDGAKAKKSKNQSANLSLANVPGPIAHKEKDPALMTMRMNLVGANPNAEVVGLEQQVGKVNYFIGNDPQKWHTDIPTFTRIKQKDVYAGVDLFYYGNERQLEYDFVVAPGANPTAISLDFQDARKTWIDNCGDLILRVAGGEIRHKKPIVYQETAGLRHTIEGRYIIKGKHQVGFEIAEYDRDKPLTIDPVVIYSTYLGGTAEDLGFGIAVDSAGNAYVTGETTSVDFPTANPAQSGTGGRADVFVSKLNPSGTALLYSTYLGGSGSGGDVGYSIAVDNSGNAYVTGYTRSNNFPIRNALQPVSGGGPDAFVAKLNTTGSALVYSTYLGGSAAGLGDGDFGYGIAVDAAGNAYVTGETTSINFPTVNPLQPTKAGGRDAFVSKLNATGTALVYSTYLGGSAYEHGGINVDFHSTKPGNRIAVDTAGNAYVTGYTWSTDFPTMNALQPANRGQADVFVSKLNAAGTALIYSTYLGGSGTAGDYAYGIAVDIAGNAYITGNTSSSDFPTANAFQPLKRNREDAFIAKLNPTGTALNYSTFLGGDGSDFAYSITLDGPGNAYVVGETFSTNFPVKNPLQPDLAGANDAFVAKLNSDGSMLIYSTYLGGSAGDNGAGIAVDTANNACVTGSTISTDFPVVNPLQFDRTHWDAFVAKILEVATLSITAIISNKGGNTGEVSASIIGGGFQPGARVTLKSTHAPDIAGQHAVVVNDSRVTATFDLRGAPPGKRDVVVTLPDGSITTLPEGFTVEHGGATQMWVDVIGRDAIRVGRPQAFNIVYGNRGNIDAVGVPLWIGGIPNDATVSLGFEITPPLVEGQRAINWSQVPTHFESNGEKVFPLFLPLVPAGQSRVLQLSLTVATTRQFQLRAWVNPPYFQSPMNPKTVDCYLAIGSVVLNGLGLIPGVPDPKCAEAIVLASLNSFVTAVQFARDLPSGDGSKIILSLVQVNTGAIDKVLSIGSACSTTITPGVSEISSAVQTAFALGDAVDKCKEGFIKTWEAISPPIRVVTSLDPNDKFGAPGAGPDHYVSGQEPLRYVVYFENQSTASAPAQDVVISDYLNLSNFDPGTFSFGPIAFGNKHIVPLHSTTDFTGDFDLRPEMNLIVKINAHLDTNSGLLIWRFSSIDPETGLPPEDPFAGFLPPGGEGNVVFTVSTKPNLSTGTVINNAASIVFDNNAAIQTPVWSNTIDNSAPNSQVHALTPAPCSASINVQWSGTDIGSGIRDYTLYVSVNGGPFTIWLNNTTITSGTYMGQFGHTYSFFSVARDHTGNIEGSAVNPDATLALQMPAPPGFTNVPPALTLNTGSDATTCGVFVSDAALGTAIAQSSCPLNIDRDGVPNGNIFPVGDTTITYTATDAIGNTASAIQVVTVVDNTPPRLIVPTPPTSPTNSSCEAAIPDLVSQSTGSDNCAGVLTLSQSPVADTVVGPGTHAITVTAIDASGNVTKVTTNFIAIPAPSFAIGVTPSIVKRGSKVILNAAFRSCSSDPQTVVLKLSLTTPRSSTLVLVLPVTLPAEQTGSFSVPLTISKSTPIGIYTLTLDVFVGGVKTSSSQKQLTVTS
jgi:hypothetical protein